LKIEFPWRQVRPHNRNNLVVLGSPVGDKRFCENYCKTKYAKFFILLDNIKQLNHLQCEAILLRYSLSFCKIVYMLRTTPLMLIDEFIAEFDLRTLDSFWYILGEKVDDVNIEEQIRLPIRLGGFGLRAGMVHGEAAYNNSRDSFDNIPTAEQKDLSDKIDRGILDRLAERKGEEESFRLELIIRKHSSTWISDIPFYGSGLEWSNQHFRTLSRWWLGLKVSDNRKCPFCPVSLSPQGKHCVACNHGGDLIRRHNAIRNVIYSIAKDACLNPWLEKGDILGDEPGDGRRPADVFIPNYKGKDGACLDVAVTCPIRGTFKQDRRAADRYGAEIKEKKYVEGFRGRNLIYIPVVFDTYGGINDKGRIALEFVLDEYVNRKAGVSKGTLWRRIMHTLNHHNASMIIRRTYDES